MKKTILTTLSLLVPLCLTACEEAPKPPVGALSAVAATAAAPTGKVATAEALDVPTEEDFETQAETQISATNLDAEVDKLEKEIGATSP